MALSLTQTSKISNTKENLKRKYSLVALIDIDVENLQHERELKKRNSLGALIDTDVENVQHERELKK